MKKRASQLPISELTGPLKLLILVMLAMGLMVGLVSKKRIARYIAGIIFLPVLLYSVFSFFKGVLHNMGQVQSILLALAILLIGALVVMRLVLGHEIWSTVVGNFIYDVFKWIITLPFRILRAIYWKIIKRNKYY